MFCATTSIVVWIRITRIEHILIEFAFDHDCALFIVFPQTCKTRVCVSIYRPCENKILLHVLQKLKENINICGNGHK